MGDSYALAVDVGSSAVRAAVVAPDGTVAALVRVERPDAHAGVTFDAELLWQQLGSACGGLPPELRGRVAAISFAGHIGTVFLDADLRPVGPGRSWADADGVDLLQEAIRSGGPGLLARSGRPAVTGGAGAAALWLRAERPGEFARVAVALSPKDFLIARLTGRLVTDRTSAAYTGLSRVGRGDWDPDLLAAAGLDRALFPAQVDATAVVGPLTRAAAEALGVPAGVPVVAGGPDGTVGAAYVIGGRSDLIADIAGTTDVLVGLVEAPEFAPTSAMVNPYPLGGFSAGGATGMTGGALAHWAALTGFGDAAAAVAALESRGRLVPGANGLRVSTALSGTRFPRWEPGRTGAVWGQRAEHGPAEFVQAAAEGAAFVVREGVDELDPQGTATIALAGGAARSKLLARLRADILNRPVLLCGEPDVSLLGAAMLAFRGADIPTRGAFDVAERPVEAISPEPLRAAAYADVFNEWQRGLDVQTGTGNISVSRMPGWPHPRMEREEAP